MTVRTLACAQAHAQAQAQAQTKAPGKSLKGLALGLGSEGSGAGTWLQSRACPSPGERPTGTGFGLQSRRSRGRGRMGLREGILATVRHTGGTRPGGQRGGGTGSTGGRERERGGRGRPRQGESSSAHAALPLPCDLRTSGRCTGSAERPSVAWRVSRGAGGLSPPGPCGDRQTPTGRAGRNACSAGGIGG